MDAAVVNSTIKLSNCYAREDNARRSNAADISVYDRVQFMPIAVYVAYMCGLTIKWKTDIKTYMVARSRDANRTMALPFAMVSANTRTALNRMDTASHKLRNGCSRLGFLQRTALIKSRNPQRMI